MAGCITDEVRREADRAERKYGPFASTHEALGVLLEEWDELRAALHANDLGAIYREAVQVSAVALRLAEQCAESPEAFRARSTGGAR